MEPNLVGGVLKPQSVAEAVSPSKVLVQEVAVRISSFGDPITDLKRLGVSNATGGRAQRRSKAE